MLLIPMDPAAACMSVTAKYASSRNFDISIEGSERRTYVTPAEDRADVSVKNDPDRSACDITALLLYLNH